MSFTLLWCRRQWSSCAKARSPSNITLSTNPDPYSLFYLSLLHFLLFFCFSTCARILTSSVAAVCDAFFLSLACFGCDLKSPVRDEEGNADPTHHITSGKGGGALVRMIPPAKKPGIRRGISSGFPIGTPSCTFLCASSTVCWLAFRPGEVAFCKALLSHAGSPRGKQRANIPMAPHPTSPSPCQTVRNVRRRPPAPPVRRARAAALVGLGWAVLGPPHARLLFPL